MNLYYLSAEQFDLMTDEELDNYYKKKTSDGIVFSAEMNYLLKKEQQMKKEEKQQAKQLLDEWLELCKNHNFDYTLTSDLDKWKQGINQEYHLRKKLKEVIDLFGVEEVDRILKITRENVVDNMLYGVIPNTIYTCFLPYIAAKKNLKPSSVSQYQVSVGKNLKK